MHQRVRATKNEERTKKPKPEFGEEKAFNHRNTGWPTIPRVACSSGHTYTHRRRHFFPPIPLTVTQSQLVGRRLAKTNAERVKKQPLYSIKDSIMDARFLFRWSIPHSGTRFFLCSDVDLSAKMLSKMFHKIGFIVITDLHRRIWSAPPPILGRIWDSHVTVLDPGALAKLLPKSAEHSFRLKSLLWFSLLP